MTNSVSIKYLECCSMIVLHLCMSQSLFLHVCDQARRGGEIDTPSHSQEMDSDKEVSGDEVRLR